MLITHSQGNKTAVGGRARHSRHNGKGFSLASEVDRVAERDLVACTGLERGERESDSLSIAESSMG